MGTTKMSTFPWNVLRVKPLNAIRDIKCRVIIHVMPKRTFGAPRSRDTQPPWHSGVVRYLEVLHLYRFTCDCIRKSFLFIY